MKDADFCFVYDKVKSDLSSEYSKVRKNCLDELLQNILNKNLKLTSDTAFEILELVIKNLNDKTEICREKAVNILLTCLKEWTFSDKDVVFLLMPVICKKLGITEDAETSEEIRLLYIKIMKILIQKYQRDFSLFLEEVVNVLVVCIRDQYPAVKQESCECTAELAKTFAEFRNYSEKIINAVSTVLKHKHYRTRVIAIGSLADIVLFGGNDSVELICGPLGECLLDQNPHVRVAVLRTVAAWFFKLRNRYSNFHYMLPLILTELSEENEKYRNEATCLWHEIGLQYIKENEAELKDKLEFLPKQLERYPKDVQRPNLGCLTLVQKEMIKIIPTLMKELVDWKTEVRIKSSELLKIIVIHAEKNIVLFIENMLPTLFRACTDMEKIVCANVICSVEMMGYFVPPNIYWYFLKPYMSENCISGHLIILASLLKNNSENEVMECFSEIIPFLASDTIFETREAISLKYLLKIVLKLITCFEGTAPDSNTINNLYLILVSIIALSDENVKKETRELIFELSSVSSSSISDLNKICLPHILHRLSETCNMWESYSLNLNILIALLSTFTDDLFKFVPNELLHILQIILNPKKDREVIFKILHAIATLLANEKEMVRSKIEFLEKIILGPLKQQLVWTAGKVAEVIRATALSLVLLFVQHSKGISTNFQTEIIPLVLSLCEDSYEESRIYSLETIICFMRSHDIKIETNTYSKILLVVSERLNDKCNLVRLKAIETLKSVLRCGPNLDVYKQGPDFENVTKALQLILLSADDDNKKIQDAALDLFNEPSIVKNMQLIFPKETLNQIINKYHDKNASALLNKYLKI